jgi:hypothetical protein
MRKQAMKSENFSRFFHPLYVLIAGFLGGGIALSLFSPLLPPHCKVAANAFFCVPEFMVVFFLMAILWCMMTILLVPGWGIFIWLFKRHIAEKDSRQRIQEMFKLLIVVVVIGVSAFVVFRSLNQFNPAAQDLWNKGLPGGETGWMNQIVNINTACLFLVFVPYVLGMVLVNLVVREVNQRIQDTTRFKTDLSFSIVNDLLIYRKVLQTFLVISGVLLSMIPLIVVALRSVLITIVPGFGEIYPVTYVIFEGLTFTLILLFIYFPAYWELSAVGQQLRDMLCPLSSLDDLKDTLEKRRALDDLLQTQMGFVDHLKNSILTFGPLISSFLVFLGIRI